MIKAKKISTQYDYPFTYSICTFVTRLTEYEGMKLSFLKNGYFENDLEFLYFDNTDKNKNTDAFEGINFFLNQAKGKYIIICHQDIEIIDDQKKLLAHINEIEDLDVNWSLLSNAGGYGPNKICYYVTYPNTGLERQGEFPMKISTADENFLLLKNRANLSISKNLRGFHFYGSDLCMISNLLGYSCWAISYNLLHKSRGTKDSSFWNCKREFKIKYSTFFKSRWLQTTSSPLYISGNYFDKIFIGSRLVLKIQKFFQK
jgi:hypothetical protein